MADSIDRSGAKGEKASRINLLDFRSIPMRTFHFTWFTFFLCFFGWMGIGALMPVIRDDLHLSQEEIGYVMVGSVAITIFARLIFGWLCDRIGARRSYFILLIMAALPLVGVGLSESFETFLLFRLAIGITGASFVITQYHTSVMFSPAVVGTVNGVAAGCGNMGGGAALVLMPILFGSLAALGFADSTAWRLAMVVPGLALFVMAFIYYRCTRDTPRGNTDVAPATAEAETLKLTASVCKDPRVWALFLAYGASFGIEITIGNIGTLYFTDTFHLGLKEAGMIAGLFGLMNIFARALGGMAGDRAGKKYGLQGRVFALALFLALEGFGIVAFSAMETLGAAVAAMLFFALFLKMANGVTYSIVPLLHSRSVGLVSGTVGAGGNVGAVLAALLFTSVSNTFKENFIIIGLAVAGVALFPLLISFSLKERASHTSPAVTPPLNEALM